MPQKKRKNKQQNSPTIPKSTLQLDDPSQQQTQAHHNKSQQAIPPSNTRIQQHEEQQQEQQQQKEQRLGQVEAVRQSVDNLLGLDQSLGQKDKQYEEFLKGREVVIEGPQLVTENVIKSYKLYKIKSKKQNSEEYDTCVGRRFSDFQFLQKQLIQNHGGSIIPILPQKNIWANINMQGNQQITNRVKGLQKYLNSLLKHKKLRISSQIKYFLFENQQKFSQKKGEYFSKIKTEQKLRQIASNAYTIGKGLFSKLYATATTTTQYKQQSNANTNNNLYLEKPSVEDVRLMEYQRQVVDLINVITVLRRVVENSVLEMKNVGLLLPQSKEAAFDSSQILNQFQDLCKYILSCNQALTRRQNVRYELEQLTKQYEMLEKKLKTNPRSQEIDVIRNKIAKTGQKCQRWTVCLLGELEESISIGKSMIQKFIWGYNQKKQSFYDL